MTCSQHVHETHMTCMNTFMRPTRRAVNVYMGSFLTCTGPLAGDASSCRAQEGRAAHIGLEPFWVDT